MAKKTSTPEDKLRALYDLQVIDTMIDKIRMMRGELPLEVQDLEDEIAGLETRAQKVQDELSAIDFELWVLQYASDGPTVAFVLLQRAPHNLIERLKKDAITSKTPHCEIMGGGWIDRTGTLGTCPQSLGGSENADRSRNTAPNDRGRAAH